MQHLKNGLLHTAWADDLLFQKLQECPEEVLGYVYADPEWPLTRIAAHIVDGAEWYKFVLTGIQWNDVSYARTIGELESLRIQLAAVHKILLDCVDLPDEMLEFEDENGPRQAMRSTVLNQIAYHSTEHRAQIFVALQSNGYEKLSADDFDVWAWEEATKKA